MPGSATATPTVTVTSNAGGTHFSTGGQTAAIAPSVWQGVVALTQMRKAAWLAASSRPTNCGLRTVRRSAWSETQPCRDAAAFLSARRPTLCPPAHRLQLTRQQQMPARLVLLPETSALSQVRMMLEATGLNGIPFACEVPVSQRHYNLASGFTHCLLPSSFARYSQCSMDRSQFSQGNCCHLRGH